MIIPFHHDPLLDGPPEPRPERHLDDGWDHEIERDRLSRYYADDLDDCYEPAPRRSVCIDRTGSRCRDPF